MISNKKCTNEEFIEKSKRVFGDRYDYSKVEYKGNKIKVQLLCKKHGSFFVRPDTHLTRKAGCKKCAMIKIADLNKNKNWLNDFKSIHGDRYDYSKVEYKNNKTKVEIICKEHGSFFMRPNSHISQKQGCPKCSKKYNDRETFIESSILVFGNLYDYSKVEYKNSHEKVEIICEKHKSFFMCPKDHINQKQGCPKCGKISMSNKYRKNLNLLISQFKEINGDRYDYSKVEYKNNITKVEIICKEHGSFKQTAKSHLRGRGCPMCNSSKGELRIANFLTERNINFNTQQTFSKCLSENNNKLKFDFYLPEMNTCIEYDGEQHFRPIEHFGGDESFKKQKIRDAIKNNYCIENNIKLIRIPFDEYDNIESILSENNI